MKPNWAILPTVPADVVREIGLPQAYCQLLYNRGLKTGAAVQEFLSPDISHSHDPWLMPDMEVAVGRLIDAIERSETIGVFGDFDIDGISGDRRRHNGVARPGGKCHLHTFQIGPVRGTALAWRQSRTWHAGECRSL